MLPALWEIIIPLILAVLLGIVIGWLMWRWRRQVITETEWIVAQQRLQSLEADNATLTVERDDAVEARSLVIIERDEAQKAERGLEVELGSLRDELATTADARDAAEGRAAALDADLAGVRGELDTSVAAVASLTSDLDTARSGLASVTADKDDAVARLGGLDSDLSGARGDLDACNAQVAALTADLEAARADADTARQATAAAELELTAARSRIEELEGADDPAVNWKQGLTTLGTPGAAHKDDLKVVNGIGPKMEALLNSFGIQSWEQLAWLSPEEVQRVDDALQEFPGRIERDEWVPQANDLIGRFPDRADRPTRETFLNRSAEN